MATPKAITNQGMISTKRMVFSVAILAVREVRPIHMPNQHRASRSAAVLSAATIAVATAIAVCQAGLMG